MELIKTHCFVVMSRDRPHMLTNALNALFAHTLNGINVYVSDNSSSREFSREIVEICERFNVMLRVSNNVSIAQHYHEIFSESSILIF